MSIKSKIKRNRLLFLLLSIVAIFVISIIVIPPMITLNNLKGKIENIILTQTGIPAKIHGNVNFSLMGRTMIIAHNISVPNGVVSSVEFDFPLLDIFNIKNADINGDIYVNGASLHVEKIVPLNINKNIVVNDSKVKFLNKEYQIIRADMSKNTVDAFVRTDQHKYEIKSIDNKFVIKNKNNDLVLTGELSQNGTAKGHISIIAQNVNKWFEFKTPKINGQFPITADISWDGRYGIKFDNIVAQNIRGSIEYKNDGYKIIKLKSDNANYDMSFFIKNPEILKNVSLDLDFYGKLQFIDNTFKHLKIITYGEQDKIIIEKIIADDTYIKGGTIDKDGAHDVHIEGQLSGLHTTCLFNGTPNDWYCKEYSQGNNITSVFSVKNGVIDADVYSTEIYADMEPFVTTIRKLAPKGIVRFYYPDMDGTLYLEKDSYVVDYTRLEDRTLNQAKVNLKFLPDFMKDEPGDFVWVNGVMIFTPNSKQWLLSKSTDFFMLRGVNFKQLTRKLDLQSLNDLPYVLSGNYKNGTISDFTVEIANHTLSGTLSGKSITLKTDILDADLFVNQSFVKRFEELSFFTTQPLLLPFETNVNIALSANKLIYNSTEYKNFVYSLHNNKQTFSISDSNRGNLLATINKDNIKYAINIQLNKFMFDKKILSDYMPLNLSNTSVTAEIKLNTYGLIAHDIINNLNGTFDASFDGGILYGLGLDGFYAYAPQITKLNAEQILPDALTSGQSKIKKMHIIGTYENGDIKTTQPIVLLMSHVDATGLLEITNNEMFAQLQMILRGTSAGPEPIELTIYPNDTRDFSLSEIMLHFDPEYMREFVKTHNKF